MQVTQRRARAPGKLIISGEHAVVHGQPAIAMAVNRYTTSITTWNRTPHINFKLLNLEYAKSLTMNTLSELRRRLQADYVAFLKGECSIRDVLKRPFELLQYSVSNLIERLNVNLPQGVDIKVESDIPMGCGMGSSAAAVVSSMRALSALLDLPWEPNQFLNLGLEAENLQHGKSSGIDLHLATFGGCMRFHQGQTTHFPVPAFPMQIVLTGTPDCTTGDCVTTVESCFTEQDMGPAFCEVTQQIGEALERQDEAAFMDGVRRNHRLLCQIGVVPEKVQSFIEAVEQDGGAAKVCGAGAVSGDAGGVLLVLAKQPLDELVGQYQYQLQEIAADQDGSVVF